jgi:uncharacterized protein
MDTFFIISGIILLLAGLAGCILPALPGPPLSYIALLLLHFTEKHQFSTKFLIIWLVITALVVVLDYMVPVWGAKKFGASKRGIWGSIIGLLLGLFIFPPFGIILGPFLGAVIGEMTAGKENSAAFKAGFGSFMGFMAGMLLKMIASGLMTWFFFKELL